MRGSVLALTLAALSGAYADDVYKVRQEDWWAHTIFVQRGMIWKGVGAEVLTSAEYDMFLRVCLCTRVGGWVYVCS